MTGVDMLSRSCLYVLTSQDKMKMLIASHVSKSCSFSHFTHAFSHLFDQIHVFSWFKCFPPPKNVLVVPPNIESLIHTAVVCFCLYLNMYKVGKITNIYTISCFCSLHFLSCILYPVKQPMRPFTSSAGCWSLTQ